jgi:hypothetical protein
VKPKSVLGCGPRHCGENSYGKSIKDYEKLFEYVDASKHKAIGEVCTTYLHFSNNVIPNIKKYIESPKIIIILRNPVDRAFSYYMHNIRDGDEILSFEDALDNESWRIENNQWLSFRLKTLGLYAEHVENYKKSFPDVKVIIYEDMLHDMQSTVNQIFEFLNIGKHEINIQERYNISGIPKSKLLHNMSHGHNFFSKVLLKVSGVLINKKTIKKIQNYVDKKNLKKVDMNINTRQELEKYFYNDVKTLSNMLGIDLNEKWKIR